MTEKERIEKADNLVNKVLDTMMAGVLEEPTMYGLAQRIATISTAVEVISRELETQDEKEENLKTQILDTLLDIQNGFFESFESIRRQMDGETDDGEC